MALLSDSIVVKPEPCTFVGEFEANTSHDYSNGNRSPTLSSYLRSAVSTVNSLAITHNSEPASATTSLRMKSDGLRDMNRSWKRLHPTPLKRFRRNRFVQTDCQGRSSLGQLRTKRRNLRIRKVESHRTGCHLPYRRRSVKKCPRRPYFIEGHFIRSSGSVIDAKDVTADSVDAVTTAVKTDLGTFTPYVNIFNPIGAMHKPIGSPASYLVSTSIASSERNSPNSLANLLPSPAIEPCETIHHRAPVSLATTGSVTNRDPPELTGLFSSHTPSNSHLSSPQTNPASTPEFMSKLQLLLALTKLYANQNQQSTNFTSVSHSASSLRSCPPNGVVMSTGRLNIAQPVGVNPFNRIVEHPGSGMNQIHQQPAISSIMFANIPQSCSFTCSPYSTVPLASTAHLLSDTSCVSTRNEVITSSTQYNNTERPTASTTIRPGQIHRLLLRESDDLSVRDGREGDLAIVYLGNGCWYPLVLPPEMNLVRKPKTTGALGKQSTSAHPHQQTHQHTELQQPNLIQQLQPKTSNPQSISPRSDTASASANSTSPMIIQATPEYPPTDAIPAQLFNFLQQRLISHNQTETNSNLISFDSNALNPTVIAESVHTHPIVQPAIITTNREKTTESFSSSSSPPYITLNQRTYKIIPITVSPDVANGLSGSS